MAESIQLILVSGFMGAGKTTFLQNILDNYRLERVGVLVNEFGAVSVDGKVLSKDGVEIVEINNGSIFCACLKAGFINTLIAFSKQPIDTLLIENSGLGDPSNFLKILADIEPYTERKYEFKGAVCVVDSDLFLDYNDIFTPVQNQVAASNFILVNKIDLADGDQIAEIHDKITKINPEAFIYDTQYGQLPFEILTEHLNASDYIGETSNHDWNRPANYILESEKVIDQSRLTSYLESIKSKILRLKGFLKAPEGFWHVDMVSEHFVINQDKTAQAEKSELVIIGRDNQDFSQLLLDEWESLFSETPKITAN